MPRQSYSVDDDLKGMIVYSNTLSVFILGVDDNDADEEIMVFDDDNSSLFGYDFDHECMYLHALTMAEVL
jgi:hypothetical protein